MQTHPHRSSGFTLIELLAAMAILSILMVVVFSIQNRVSQAWVQGEKRTETFQNARLVLETMSRELEGAIAGTHPITSRQITFLNLPNENSLPNATASLNPTPPNDQLFFISSASNSQSEDYNDLTETGYFVAFCNNSFQGMRPGYYYLMRHRCRSDSSGNWDFLSNPAWETTPGYGAAKSVLLENVLRLEFRFQALDPRVGTEPEAYTNGTAIVDGWTTTGCPDPCSCIQPQLAPPAGLGISSPETTLPRAVHIRLSVLATREANLLASYLAGQGSITTGTGIGQANLGMVIPNCQGQNVDNITDPLVQKLVREGTHVFYKTVYLRNSP